jgi:rhodanese-related sulfurtransferase
VKTISREELRQKIENGDPFVLVDALSPMSFAHSRLPGSINIPPERVEAAPRVIPDRSSDIVVYCMNSECDSSVIVATRLRALGYTKVWHYADGKQDWIKAGLPLERGRDAAMSRPGGRVPRPAG